MLSKFWTFVCLAFSLPVLSTPCCLAHTDGSVPLPDYERREGESLEGRASSGHPWLAASSAESSPCGRQEPVLSIRRGAGGWAVLLSSPWKRPGAIPGGKGIHLLCFKILFQHKLAKADWALLLRTLVVYSHNWYSWAGSLALSCSRPLLFLTSFFSHYLFSVFESAKKSVAAAVLTGVEFNLYIWEILVFFLSK